ncbi:N-lysine methyltransferase setd6-like [Heracleum sosnowskyi]|uniref:N-lysine methyltransferase setd6-like n=1 Tax=Heracleum sosnowskyi TaxID=360622 RepID=A0AAD8IM45_9APIA|nr:N-lysine methyltransferase setd6-like [Heracleum sosnowskyi]
MENVEHVTYDHDDRHSLLLKLSENDPLFDKKKKLLQVVGISPDERIHLKASYTAAKLSSVLGLLLQKARIIYFNEVDLYFAASDVGQLLKFHNPRNELEALHSVMLLIDNSILSSKHSRVDVLQDLRDMTLDKINALGNNIREDTIIVENVSCDRETCLLQWGESEGVKTKLDIAYVEGAGRGAIARENLKAGDIALEIPVTVIISEEVVHKSDMFPILENFEGITSETMLLLWSMKEKHNRDSKFKFFFDALPEVFNTGLSFGVDALLELDGTLLLEEIVQAKEHLRSQYDELFPALYHDHPDIFPPDLYTWEHFLWACELWYSNSMKILFPDGRFQTCLVPVAGFLNHSINPHIMQYGKVDSNTNSLKFPLSRPCNAGEQCFLSYGKLSSSHLITFYGFSTQGDNPYDVVPIDLDLPDIDDSENGSLMSDWTSHMVRGTWLSKNHEIFHYGLPSPLLDHFRRAQGSTVQPKSTTQENLAIELEILLVLCSTFEDMMQAICDTDDDDRENRSWDVKLASKFKKSQKKIFSSIVTSCKAGCKLVENELCKCTT